MNLRYDAIMILNEFLMLYLSLGFLYPKSSMNLALDPSVELAWISDFL